MSIASFVPSRVGAMVFLTNLMPSALTAMGRTPEKVSFGMHISPG